MLTDEKEFERVEKSIAASSESLNVSQAGAERYRAIADSAFDLIAELDAEGQFVYLSPNYAASTGFEPTELIGTSIFERLHKDETSKMVAEFTAALARSRAGRAEHRFRHANGEYLWFESALRGIGEGAVQDGNRRVMLISREVTSRQRHQVELETLISLAKSVHAQTELPAVVKISFDQLTPLLPCDALLLAMRGPEDAGTSCLHVYGTTASGQQDLYLSGETQRESFLWEAVSETRLRVENIWNAPETASGLELPVRSFVAIPISEDDKQIGALCFVSSRPFVWTEEHARLCAMAAEQATVAIRGIRLLDAAQAAEEKYRTLVNDIDAVVWEADTLTKSPVYVSPQIEQWLGVPAAEWLNTRGLWRKVVHASDQERLQATIQKNFHSPEPWQVEFRANNAEGKTLWLRMLATPEVRDGTVVKLRGLVVDITERQQYVEAITESNAILGATLEASADGMCVVDEHGFVVSLNRRFAEMFRVPSSLVTELKDKRQLIACVLSLMAQPEEFVEKLNGLRRNPADSSRDEVDLRDGRILERYSAPALTPDGRSFGRVWTFSDITERKRYEQQLAHQAFHDPLTNLPNRTLFMDRVEHAVARSARGAKPLAVLFVDMDRFKLVNDTMGHDQGDILLREVASRLSASLRPGDTAARFGGDEFVVLLEDLDGIEGAQQVTERLIDVLHQSYTLDGREFDITASIGVAMAETGEPYLAGDLLRHADIAMYRAKNKGKARYEIFDTKMSAAALEKLQLEVELRQAVKWNQLILAYQPLVDLTSDRVVGLEALVRWQHPDRGVVSPADFIPIAEESGMILPIGNWVLREACKQARAWNDEFPSEKPLKMSVNLSARQIQSDIVTSVAAVLEETGLPASQLELEITETAVMEDAESTIKILEGLKQLGVKLAIDDFGTGYSSLAYIERFPLDALKIDRSFVAQIGRNGKNGHGNGKSRPERSVIMQAVQTLGQGLGIPITAEGIETPEQLEELRDMGCAIGQGFFWAKPLESAAIESLLRQKN